MDNTPLWDKESLANYLGVSKNHLDRFTSIPEFPKPILLPTTSGKSQPKWLPRLVIKYVESFQKAQPC